MNEGHVFKLLVPDLGSRIFYPQGKIKGGGGLKTQHCKLLGRGVAALGVRAKGPGPSGLSGCCQLGAVPEREKAGSRAFEQKNEG